MQMLWPRPQPRREFEEKGLDRGGRKKNTTRRMPLFFVRFQSILSAPSPPPPSRFCVRTAAAAFFVCPRVLQLAILQRVGTASVR